MPKGRLRPKVYMVRKLPQDHYRPKGVKSVEKTNLLGYYICKGTKKLERIVQCHSKTQL